MTGGLLLVGIVLGLYTCAALASRRPHSFIEEVAMRRLRLSTRQRRGQSFVELAIVLPVIVLLVFGSIAAIQIAMVNYTVNAAARSGANQAALVGGPDGTTGPAPLVVASATGTIAQTIQSTLDGGMATQSSHSGATITVTCATTPCKRYQPIVVTVEYADQVWVPAGPFKTFTARASFTRSSEQDRQTTPGVCGMAGAPPCP